MHVRDARIRACTCEHTRPRNAQSHTCTRTHTYTRIRTDRRLTSWRRNSSGQPNEGREKRQADDDGHDGVACESGVATPGVGVRRGRRTATAPRKQWRPAARSNGERSRPPQAPPAEPFQFELSVQRCAEARGPLQRFHRRQRCHCRSTVGIPTPPAPPPRHRRPLEGNQRKGSSTTPILAPPRCTLNAEVCALRRGGRGKHPSLSRSQLVVRRICPEGLHGCLRRTSRTSERDSLRRAVARRSENERTRESEREREGARERHAGRKRKGEGERETRPDRGRSYTRDGSKGWG